MITLNLNNTKLPIILVLALSLLWAAFGLWSKFFIAEDGWVLFHRSNYTDLDPIFFYNGYISLYPQIVAYLAAHLHVALQVFLYSAVSFFVWLCFVFYLLRVTESKWLILLLICFFCMTGTIYTHNLTYSAWPALGSIGLIGIDCLRSSRKLSMVEFLLIIIFASSSPLSFLMLPLYLALLVRNPNKTINILIIAALSLLFIFLRDATGPRSDNLKLISNLTKNLMLLFIDFDQVFPKVIKNFSIYSPMPILRFLCFIFIFLWPLGFLSKKIRKENIGILLFSLSVCLIYLVSFSSHGLETSQTDKDNFFALPMTDNRYHFLPLTCITLWFAIFLKNYFKVIISYVGILSFSITAAIILVKAINNSHEYNSDFMALIVPRTGTQIEREPDLSFKLIRNHSTENNVAFGNFLFKKSDCKTKAEASKNIKFEIFCETGTKIYVQ